MSETSFKFEKKYTYSFALELLILPCEPSANTIPRLHTRNPWFLSLFLPVHWQTERAHKKQNYIRFNASGTLPLRRLVTFDRPKPPHSPPQRNNCFRSLMIFLPTIRRFLMKCMDSFNEKSVWCDLYLSDICGWKSIPIYKLKS